MEVLEIDGGENGEFVWLRYVVYMYDIFKD